MPSSAYDEVLYPPGVHIHTQVDRHATVGRLRGMRPAPIDSCRVLELGCGVGTNLIAMANNWPKSSFLGLDLASKPIQSGQADVNELGLRNIELIQADVLEANKKRFGPFDYIIAHGLYSWVPDSVREHILGMCREMLEPQGIGYISYNAYPGNHLRDLARGIIRFHAKHFEEPAEKIRQARGILQFLATARSEPNAYTTALQSELERVVKYADAAFFHDDLSDINRSFYFRDFIRDAENHDLQFIGESSPNEVDPDKVTPEALQRLSELESADETTREQYKDFVVGCGFRRTLVCHKEVPLAARRLPEMVKELFLSCDASPVDASDGGTVFKQPKGGELASSHPPVIAALRRICEAWPCAISFETALLESGADDSGLLADILLKAYESGVVQLHTMPRVVVNRVSDRPIASPFARLQARRGNLVTCQLHKLIRLTDPLSGRLVTLLDGTQDHGAILKALLEFAKSEQVDLRDNDRLLTDPDEIASVIHRRVPEVLQALAREAMLVG
jgi:methyltransferase-like protein/SAM-dependent methyltransferase